MQFLKNTVLALAGGYVLFFYSERVFWGAFKPGDGLADVVVTWLAYSLSCRGGRIAGGRAAGL